MHAPWRIAALCAIPALLASPLLVRADRFVLHNGRTIEGEVIREDDNTVTVEIWGTGSSLTQRLSKAQVKSWYKPAREGQPYVIIPIFGEIGNDVTVGALRAGLREARAASPRYIILAIDSPGGQVGEMIGMIELLSEASLDFEIVAYIKSAYSSAAVIAMSCRHVYMKPGATIGATVPFRMTEDGPKDVDAKFRSVIEAQMRAASQHAGHADLLIRAMSEIDLELFLAHEDGETLLRTTGPGKMVKGKGQILTLTADEAAECGLARIAPDMTDLGNQVCGGRWHEVNKRAWNTTIAAVVLQRQRERETLRRQQFQIAQREAFARIKPELGMIERRIAEQAARSVAAQNAIADLTSKCDWEIQHINAEYNRAVALAKYQTDPNAALARAAEVANSRAAAVRQSLDVNTAHLRADGQAAQLEIGLLRDRQNRLLATIPTD